MVLKLTLYASYFQSRGPIYRAQLRPKGNHMQAVELIRKKRDGSALDTREIDWFIAEYMREQIPDYQMSAWLMAVYWRGMDARETSDLTMAMAHSGQQLHVRDTISPVVDKHSTGGVGDKVTLA